MNSPPAILLVAALGFMAVADLASRGLLASAPVVAPEPPVPFLDPVSATANLPEAGAFGATVIAGLLLLLFVYRRRRYVLYWTLSWLCLAASQVIIAPLYETEALARVMIGLSQFTGILGALLLVLSADSYRRQAPFNRRYLVGLLPLFIWFALVPLVLGLGAVLVPGYLIAAGVTATAGIGYLGVLRRGALLGAGVIGIPLLFVGISYASIAISISRSVFVETIPLEIVLTNGLLYVFAAMGMHLMVFEDMTYELRATNRRLEAAQAELHQLVITDPLTGCHNRRFFDQVISHEIQHHRRYRTPLTLMFLDVNRFKEVNDRLGHEAGDRVLQYVAQFLKRHIREADYVFRWGGDEFLVLMSCGLEEANRKAGELKSAFRNAPETAAWPPGLGLSVGCAPVGPETTDIMPLVREADQRMYEDKLESRGR